MSDKRFREERDRDLDYISSGVNAPSTTQLHAILFALGSAAFLVGNVIAIIRIVKS